MSERYSKLYSLPENLYIEGSPLLIKAGALLKDTQTGKTIAQLKFANICAKTVKAVFVAVDSFDIAGNKLNGVDEYQYLDIAAIRSDEFGQKNAILLPDNVTRKIDCFITKVIFADDSVWEAPADSKWEPLKERTLRKPFDDAELERQFHIEYGENFKYEFESVKDLWYCTCGAINHKDEETCHTCKKSFAKYANLDIAALEEKKNARLEAERIAADKKAEEEKRIAEENAVKAKKTQKLIKKLCAIIIPLIVVIIAAYFITTLIVIPNSKYNAAVDLMEGGNYEEAISAFESFDGYRNSEEMINDCKYNIAIELMSADKYEEAINLFKLLSSYNYMDSKEKLEECHTALDAKYNDAVALMDKGKYAEALAAFEVLDGYQDSDEKIFLIKKISLSNMKEGDYIKFGTYEQDGNFENGKEDIEWLVLELKGRKALVISQYILDCKQYNTRDVGITWDTCSLRKWLNDEFITSAFSTLEESMISTETVSADKYAVYATKPGFPTRDKVFLLSSTETNIYFSSDSERECSPTINCGNSGAWWLRSPGRKQEDVECVNYSGEIIFLGCDSDNVGIRPAMWIDLSKIGE